MGANGETLGAVNENALAKGRGGEGLIVEVDGLWSPAELEDVGDVVAAVESESDIGEERNENEAAWRKLVKGKVLTRGSTYQQWMKLLLV